MSRLTVQELIDHIVSAMGGPLESTADTVKAGDTSQPVAGVVTTFMATVPIIQRAVELRANVVFTHEPTFYNAWDEISFLQNDPVYRAKRRLLEETGIVVYRLHDYPHGMARPVPGSGLGDPREDPFFVGLVEALNWSEYADANVPYFCTIPSIRLGDLVQQFKDRLHLRSIRVTGDLQQECRRVLLCVGAPGIGFHIDALARFDADVITVGESPEWEAFSYAADANALGIKRAVVALGHEPSEEPGMVGLAAWLRKRFPDLPVTHVASDQPIVAV